MNSRHINNQCDIFLESLVATHKISAHYIQRIVLFDVLLYE